jgi:pilus assembly protein CpaC
MYKYLLSFILFISFSGATVIKVNTTDGDQHYDLLNGTYKVISFDQKVIDLRVNDSKRLFVEFVKDKKHPFKKVKILAKSVGPASMLVTFANQQQMQFHFNIIKDFRVLRQTIAAINPHLTMDQIENKIILKGEVNDEKEKSVITNLLRKSGLNTKQDFIDLTTIATPSKMIRVKLYVVEINNDDGETIKNGWSVGYKNYLRVDHAKDYSVEKEFIPAIGTVMESALTLSGGLTAGANYLGNGFSTGLILNYLKSKGVAKVLDETTLLTLENQKAKFHAGGTIFVKTSTTNAEGLPTSEIKPLEYGLLLKIKAENIINNHFINLAIITESAKIDQTNNVDGIPGFTKKSVSTNVIIKDGSTIVLGGLISSSDAKNYTKIPLLGDLPVLGRLFKSEDFQQGKSELVFFITPEVVNPDQNNQIKKLIKKQQTIITDFKTKPNKIIKNSIPHANDVKDPFSIITKGVENEMF